MPIFQILTHLTQYQKSHLLLQPSVSLEKSLRIGNCQAHGDGYILSQTLIFA